MEAWQATWTRRLGWTPPLAPPGESRLVLVFGEADALRSGALQEVQALGPDAVVVGCSTAGQIQGTAVSDEGLVATFLSFDGTRVRMAHEPVDPDAEGLGHRLGAALPHEDLRHVLLFSDGIHVNGSALVRGLVAALPPGVQVTGGLAGDGDRFGSTHVVVGDMTMEGVVAVGLYGGRIRVGYGSLGGWDPFGPLRLVTRSDGNVLYELDGRPALALYKKYLGDQADGLPSTGLLFPLTLRLGDGPGLVRTILAVDEDAQSLTFAGDIPMGAKVQLMRANFDRLVDGAHGAAEDSLQGTDGPVTLALLISCVGRRLVLKQRVEEELEAVRGVVGPDAILAGFYSYGEVCPAAPDADCELHNQTMTITTLREA